MLVIYGGFISAPRCPAVGGESGGSPPFIFVSFVLVVFLCVVCLLFVFLV